MTDRTTSSLFVLTSLIALSATAQQASQPPIKGMASTVGLYVYPKNEQSATTQQLTDEQQCFNEAKVQTGFDPDATSKGSSNQVKPDSKEHSEAKDALRGAAVSGVAGGDPAIGAERGAILGEIRARRQPQQKQQATQKQTEAAKSEQQNLDNFKRSTTSCLSARGYSVR